MVTLVNRAKVATAATGSGSPITLGAAEVGFQTFAAAGVANADVVRYVIEDGTAWEIGTGTYTATGTTLSRTLGESSTGSLLVLTGSAVVYVAATAADLAPVLDLYAENYDGIATKPLATGTNAVSIGRNSSASADRSTAIGSNSSATALFSTAVGYLNSASATGATAMAQSSSASGTYSLAINGSAASSYSAAIGYNSGGGKATAITGSGAMALGGSYASGVGSLAAAISNNTSLYGATGLSSVAIGPLAKASSTYGMAFGPGALATGSGSLAIGTSYANYGSVSSGSTSITIGDGNAASQSYSAVLGYLGKSAVRGKFVWANGSFGGGNAEGSSQTGTIVLRSDTTDATAEALTSDNSTASTNNQVILPNNSAYTFHGTIIARQQASGSDYASWEIKGALLRDGTAVSTVLGNGIIDKLFATAGAAAWAVALTADTTNGGLAVTVTGAAATNIRWVATVNTSEVTYA